MMKPEFHTIDNVFSNGTLQILHKYCSVLPSDNSSYDVWPDVITDNKTLPECFSTTLYNKDRIVVLADLFEHSALPCANKSWLKSADIAIQKIVPGGGIREHQDHCKFSLTVFLNDPSGGEFHWWNELDDVHVVKPKYNTGVYAFYEKCEYGAYHNVTPVTGNINRYTLQLFIFDKENEVKGAIYK